MSRLMNIGKKTCTKFRNAIKDGICPDADKKIKCKEYDEIEIAGIFDCGFSMYCNIVYDFRDCPNSDRNRQIIQRIFRCPDFLYNGSR